MPLEDRFNNDTSFFLATCGELNLGMNYFEGDILLTQQQKDLINASKNASNIQARDLVRDTSKLWIDAVVPYLLADDLSKFVQQFTLAKFG